MPQRYSCSTIESWLPQTPPLPKLSAATRQSWRLKAPAPTPPALRDDVANVPAALSHSTYCLLLCEASFAVPLGSINHLTCVGYQNAIFSHQCKLARSSCSLIDRRTSRRRSSRWRSG